MDLKVEFKYDEGSISIQTNIKEKFKEIVKQYKSKGKYEHKSFVFLYDGKATDEKEDLALEELIKGNSKQKEKIIMLVYSSEDTKKPKEKVMKSKNIICPECQENIRIEIKDFKINLYGCKNRHKIDDILLSKFEDKQKLDLSTIICNICNKYNKASTINNCFLLLFMRKKYLSIM